MSEINEKTEANKTRLFYDGFHKQKYKHGLRRKNYYKKKYNNFDYYSSKYNFKTPWHYWRKTAPIHKRSRQIPENRRSPSPFSGTEEYNLKKIQETSDMIKKRLMMPECDDVTNTSKSSPVKIEQPVEYDKKTKNESEKCSVKTNSKKLQYNVEEIHQKIMTHITKLSHGKKMNLICCNSSGYDIAIQQIHKQKRLELSKALRDMCSNQNMENSEVINSIIPDIGIKLEDLPIDIIRELSSTLNLNFNENDELYTRDATGLEINTEILINTEKLAVETHNQSQINSEMNIKQEPNDLNSELMIKNEDVTQQLNINKTTANFNSSYPNLTQPLCNSVEFPLNVSNIKQEILDMESDFDCMQNPEFDANLNDSKSLNSIQAVSVQLQTEAPILKSVNLQTDSVNNQNRLEINQSDIKNFDDAIRTMFLIDSEIERLTKLRQSIFTDLQNRQNNYNSSEINENLPPKIDAFINEKDCNQRLTKSMDSGHIPEKILVIKVIDDILLAASESGKLYFMNLKTAKMVTTIKVTKFPITSLCHWISVKKNITEQYIFVGSTDTKMYEINFETKTVLGFVQLPDFVQCMELAWNCIFIGTTTGYLLRYSTRVKQIKFQDKISPENIMVLKATQEGARKVLLVGMKNAPVFVRDAMSGLHLRTMNQLVTPTVYSLVLENSLVYCGTTAHDILVFNFNDGNLVHKLTVTNSKGVCCMKVVKNLLFASCYDGNIYVYNVKNHLFVGIMKGPGGVILSMEVVRNIVIVGTMSLKFKSLLIPEYILGQNKI